MGGLTWLFALMLLVSGRAAGSNQASPHLHVGELTVTSLSTSSFQLTWYSGDPTDLVEMSRWSPVESDTTVRYGTSPDPTTWTSYVAPGPPTAYHHVEITGLDPGTTYWFEASSGGVRAVSVSPGLPRVPSPASLVTLTPPPGRHLLRVAVANDLHVGESVAGLLVGNFPPGLAVDPADPYSEFMLRSVVDDANAAGADVMVANGDVTSEARPEEVSTAADILDGFHGDLVVLRGNHDRSHRGSEYETCTPVPASPEYHDCFADVFGPPSAGERRNYAVDVGAVRIVGLDSSAPTTGYGDLDTGTLDFLAKETVDGRPSLVFMHHLATFDEVAHWMPWPGFHIPPAQMSALDTLLADRPGVLAVFSGHTHRNRRGVCPRPETLCLEVGSAKEHIGGYDLVDIYEGGLTVEFRQASCGQCLVWSERTRRLYFGLYDKITEGALGDRAFTHDFAAPIGGG